MSERSGNNSLEFIDIYLAHHGMCFTASGLSIGENGTIIAEQYVLYKAIRSFRIDQFLLGFFVKYMIKCKGFGIIGIIKFKEVDLIIFLVGLNDGGASSLFLLGIHGTNPYNNLNGFTHLWKV